MIGKFVATTTQLQAQCRGPNGYKFAENPAVAQLFDVPLMDYDVSIPYTGFQPLDTDFLSTRCN